MNHTASLGLSVERLGDDRSPIKLGHRTKRSASEFQTNVSLAKHISYDEAT